MNKLDKEARAKILSLLCEGMSNSGNQTRSDSGAGAFQRADFPKSCQALARKIFRFCRNPHQAYGPRVLFL